MNIPEELIDAYVMNMEVLSHKYELMGKMLDINIIKKRIECLNVSEVYIYGGGYLGIQCYLALVQYLKIPALVDKKGKSIIERKDIPVINIQQFQEIYHGQNIIITPVMYYHEILKELISFVPEKKIWFLGEFLGGILS